MNVENEKLELIVGKMKEPGIPIYFNRANKRITFGVKFSELGFVEPTMKILVPLIDSS